VRFLAFLSITLWYLPASANENDNDIFSYDLAELAKIKVKVATKSEVSLRYVPATVSVFTQSQLVPQGIDQLADLADFTPGFSTYNIFGEKVFVTRGQKAGSFENNKHLVLLDGIALNHARANKAPIEYELPLYAMGQVEMLTGPASSLYGVGAFFGIANLVSDLKESSNFETIISYQPQYQATQYAFKTNIHSKFGHSFITYSDFSKEASKQEVGPDFSPLQKYYDDQEASFAYFRHTFHEGPSLGYIRLERGSGLGEHWTGDFSTAKNNINWLTEISFVQWPVELTPQLTLKLQWVNNDSSEEGLATPFTREVINDNPDILIKYTQYQVNVESDQGQIELHWNPSNEQEFLLGLSHTEKQDVGGFFDSEKSFETNNPNQTSLKKRVGSSAVKFYGIYGQYITSFKQWWDIQLTVGLRYDSGEYQQNKFSQLSPRITMVKEIDQNLLLRVSYSSALRSPDLKEYALNDESEEQIKLHAKNSIETLNKLGGNLEAEVFNSLEIAAMYNYNSFSSQITVFRNKSEYALISQPITFVNVDGNKQITNSFENSASNINLWGYEFSGKWFVSKNSFLQGHISQAFNVNGGQQAIQDTPELTAVLSYNMQLFGGHVFIAQHYNKYRSDQVSSIMQTDFGYQSILTEKLTVRMTIDNLFDHQDYLPQNEQQGNPLPERSIQVAVNYTF